MMLGVTVRFEHAHEFRMQEGLAAEDAEEAVAVLLGAADQLVQIVEFDDLARLGHIDPATLAPQIAAINDGNVQIGWKKLAALQPAFV